MYNLDRESGILLIMVAQGFTDKEIAECHHQPLGTVKAKVVKLLKQTKSNSRQELAYKFALIMLYQDIKKWKDSGINYDDFILDHIRSSVHATDAEYNRNLAKEKKDSVCY